MHELYGAPPGQVLRSIAKSGGQFVKHLYLVVPQAVINTAVNENANLFSANVLFEVFQNINSDGAGKVFVLAGRIDFGYQLINADAFFFGYGGKFGVEFVFQRNAGLVSAGDDYGFLRILFLRKASMETTVATPLEVFFGSSSISAAKSLSVLCEMGSSSKLKLRPNLA